MFETALLANPPAGSLQMVIESTVPPGGGSWYILMAERKAQTAGPQLQGQADTQANSSATFHSNECLSSQEAILVTTGPLPLTREFKFRYVQGVAHLL